MPVSPRDFALWSAATGNRYPQTAEEKAAAAPEAYDFVRNIGRTGVNAPGPRVGGRIVFEQPISAQHADDNSVFHSPVTPDNNIPKVAGTYGNTMTGEHYDNQQRDLVEDNKRANSIVDYVGKTALAAGLTAAGVALATNPAAQSAVRSAMGSVQHQAKSVGSRISSFLGNLGAARVTDSEFVQNTGDVTPPTTAQNYRQSEIPTSVQAMQVAKGSHVGTPERSAVPTTTEAVSVKPVTESDIITSTQSFSPKETGYRSSSLAAYEQAVPPSEALQTARRQAATEQLTRAAESIRSREPYQTDLPGINTTLMALRSKDVGINPQDAGLYQPEPPKLGPTTEQLQLITQTPDPWTGEYTPTVAKVSEQTADLSPSVGERVQNFITVLDLGKKQIDPETGKAQNPYAKSFQVHESQIGRGAEPSTGLTGSLVEEPIFAKQVEPASTELTSAPTPPTGPTRRGRVGVPAEHRLAYNIMKGAAERNINIPFDRALEIVNNPQTSLTFEEQQAFEFAEPVALAGQSFAPGQRVTGQLRTVRTGEQRGQRAEDLLERYARENVSGLTPAGRQSAGAQRLRGVMEQDEPRAVLSTPTGRTMRNIGALNPEALAEGVEEYAPHTFATTGSNPESAAKSLASATSPERVRQMNSLFGPENSATLLHVKTENGIKTISPRELKGDIKNTANNVFNRAAVYHANQQGINLPDKNQDYLGYLQTANAVLYGNPDVAKITIEQMGRDFNWQLRSKHGLKMEAANNPNTEEAAKALHTFMNVARGTTVGQLALEHFNTLAGRARSQGRVRTSTSMVPVGIPGPSQSQVQQIMGQAGLGQPSLNPPSIGY